MNTRIVGAVAVLVLLLGIGGFIILGKNQSTKNANLTPSPTKSENTTASQTLSDILNSKQNQECTFSYKADDSLTTGTTFLAGTKMRTDFKITKDNKTSDYHIIRNSDINYIWGSDLQTGIKMTIKAEDLENNKDLNQYLDYNQKVDYKCSPWATDNMKFIQPSNVKFTDFSNFTLPKSGAGGSCSACSYLDGEDKTACLDQLNCPLAE